MPVSSLRNWCPFSRLYFSLRDTFLSVDNLEDTHESMSFVQSHMPPCEDTHGTSVDEEMETVTFPRESIFGQSPFYQEIQAIYVSTMSTLPETTNSNPLVTPNPRRNTALAARFMKSAMPYAPLWSSILERPMRYARGSSTTCKSDFVGWREAFVEGFFRTMKHDIFSSEALPVMVQDFVQVTARTMKGRCIRFLEQLSKVQKMDEVRAEKTERYFMKPAAVMDKCEPKSPALEDREIRFREAANLRKKYLAASGCKAGALVNETALQPDRFKCHKKRLPPTYLNKRLSSGFSPISNLPPLPTNGFVRMPDGVSLKAMQTCCLDVILASISAAYMDGAFRHADFTGCEALQTCMQALSRAKSEREAQIARAQFILAHDVFTKSGIVSIPLRKVKNKLEISIDTSDILLVERLVGTSLNMVEEFQCLNANCGGKLNFRLYFSIHKLFSVLRPADTKRIHKKSLLVDTRRIHDAVRQYSINQTATLCAKCGHERLLNPVTTLSGNAPPLIIFTNTKDTDENIESPEVIHMFGEEYAHRATTYLRRAASIYGSGHYMAAIKFRSLWHLYDGMKKNSKPAFVSCIENSTLATKLGVTPSVIIYDKI